jgi:hypothetical protein
VVAQYLRKLSLIVASDSGEGLELSDLRVRFQVCHWTLETPNTLVARVYNLAPSTTQQIQREFTQVQIQAGYEGNFGTIFKGTLKQFRRGRESPTDDYLDLFASDSDIAYNWGVINRTLAAGYTSEQVLKACGEAFNNVDPTTASPDQIPDGLSQFQSPRGRAMFGMARDQMRDLAAANKMNWNLNGNRLQMLAQSAYLPGQPVEINAATGMIGVPEQTQDGIEVACLLNPSISAGSRIKLNNADIGQYLKANAPVGLAYTSVDLPISLNADGLYKVIYLDHIGDTRASSWETRLTCIAIDGTILPMGQALRNTTVAP